MNDKIKEARMRRASTIKVSNLDSPVKSISANVSEKEGEESFKA